MAFLGIRGLWLCFMDVRFIFLLISLGQEGMMLFLKIPCRIGLIIILSLKYCVNPKCVDELYLWDVTVAKCCDFR